MVILYTNFKTELQIERSWLYEHFRNLSILGKFRVLSQVLKFYVLPFSIKKAT